MAGVFGCVAFDLVAALLERVDQLSDLAGRLEQVFVGAELLVLGGELGVELDSRHGSSMAANQVVALEAGASCSATSTRSC